MTNESSFSSTSEAELIRERWRRFRRELALDSVRNSEYGQHGLAQYVDGPAVRFCVIPADTEHALLKFDDEFWNWWTTPRRDPFREGVTFGTDTTIGPDMVIRFERSYRENEKKYEEAVAIHRSGVIEFCIGDSAATYALDSGELVIRLASIVGRIWVTAARYHDVVTRFQLSGPYEVVLAVIDCKGRWLGGLAPDGESPAILSGDGPHALVRTSICCSVVSYRSGRAKINS